MVENYGRKLWQKTMVENSEKNVENLQKQQTNECCCLKMCKCQQNVAILNTKAITVICLVAI